jgi:hypothetical protein
VKSIFDEEMEKLGWVFNEKAGPDELPYRKLDENGHESDVPFAGWVNDSIRVMMHVANAMRGSWRA